MSHPLTSLHSAGLSGASRGAGKPGQGLVAPQVAALLPTVRLAMDSILKAGRIFLSSGEQESTLFKSLSGHDVMSLLKS